MLLLNRLQEYQAELQDQLRDDQNNRLFNYIDMVIDDSELSRLLKERTEEENSYMISVVPDFGFKGSEDNARVENMLSIFVLDKTDYSEHDRDSFKQIFATTQIKALALVKKLLDDKANSSSLFCGFLTWLNEDSILVQPVWKKDGCNGWVIHFNFESNL